MLVTCQRPDLTRVSDYSEGADVQFMQAKALKDRAFTQLQPVSHIHERLSICCFNSDACEHSLSAIFTSITLHDVGISVDWRLVDRRQLNGRLLVPSSRIYSDDSQSKIR